MTGYDATTHALYLLGVVRAAKSLAAAVCLAGGPSKISKDADAREAVGSLLDAVDELVRWRKNASLRGVDVPEDHERVAEALAELRRAKLAENPPDPSVFEFP